MSVAIVQEPIGRESNTNTACQPVVTPVYNVVGVVKSCFHFFRAVPRKLLALRAGSGVKGAPRSAAFIGDP